MLAFAVRGVILLGVLSWYSATVWRMIDGYFKDQFRAYLQDEYRRHPRMQADVEKARDVDKGSISDALPAEPSSSHLVEETYGPDAATTGTTTKTTTTPASSCPADITDACRRLPSRSATGRKPEEEVTGGTSKNAVAAAAVRADKNAFPENAALESRKPPSSSTHGEGRRPSTINQDADREQEAIEGRSEVVLTSSASSPRRRREGGFPGGGRKGIPSGMSRQPSRKRRVNTIVLTDADFAGARTSDDDFSEFEEEEEDGEGQGVFKEGILVSELPFKPKADIGDLARVTAEEFCPLTPEDEASCGETTTWP
ncbi:hypothetical protein DMN91_004880 [Ooceraea biroi]|uniref:Uncharacterized protein n=1 Tax=Ooceraea biroi TaxID=2015173 RepID=A0A3L8DQQ6_OOCBI|nr:uncharacterized protein LOC113561987 [Ooceraea biroi]RLU22602.1 hypothetical protein DMN91_004880 [Ooceraea biroi]